MQKLFSQMACLLFFIFNVVHAHNTNDCSASISTSEFVQCEKIYLQLDQVMITLDGIFVLLEDDWITTDAIYKDSFGLFFKPRDEWTVHWKCPICGFKNSAWKRSCGNCGYKPRH